MPTESWQSIGTAGIRVARYQDAVVIYFRAEIDLHNQGRLIDFCTRILDSTERLVTVNLDLSDVTYLDSSGLRALDGLCGGVVASGGTCRIVAPGGSAARKLLDILGPETTLTGLVCEQLDPPKGSPQA